MVIVVAFKGYGSASGSCCLAIRKMFNLKQTLIGFSFFSRVDSLEHEIEALLLFLNVYVPI